MFFSVHHLIFAPILTDRFTSRNIDARSPPWRLRSLYYNTFQQILFEIYFIKYRIFFNILYGCLCIVISTTFITFNTLYKSIFVFNTYFNAILTPRFSEPRTHSAPLLHLYIMSTGDSRGAGARDMRGLCKVRQHVAPSQSRGG
jgi:hypothetical protein